MGEYGILIFLKVGNLVLDIAIHCNCLARSDQMKLVFSLHEICLEECLLGNVKLIV